MLFSNLRCLQKQELRIKSNQTLSMTIHQLHIRMFQIYLNLIDSSLRLFLHLLFLMLVQTYHMFLMMLLYSLDLHHTNNYFHSSLQRLGTKFYYQQFLLVVFFMYNSQVYKRQWIQNKKHHFMRRYYMLIILQYMQCRVH